MAKKHKVSMRGIGEKLRTQFLTGIIIVVPVAVSIWILVWLFNTLDDILQPIVVSIWGRTIPGLGIIVTVIIIYFAGVIANNIVGKRLVRFGDSLLSKIPIFRPLYSSIKNIMKSLSGSNRTDISQVALIEFPKPGMKTVGFVTNEHTDQSGEKLLSILIPTAPNPTSGFLQIVKESDVVKTSMSVDDALKMIVSIGSTMPDSVKEQL